MESAEALPTLCVVSDRERERERERERDRDRDRDRDREKERQRQRETERDGRFGRVFSIQFSISSLVIARYRRIEPKFGSPNFSNVFIFISLFSAPLHQPERGS